ncbi:Alpha/Beta hydrolase protein [Myxozyma melibiosi]|uniref:Alpha/Beta hydrolase protein n=1 Tax=Myxozyma melibiosi TaxID=54550 RepID=A0ABR1F2H1_9ASCO
MAEACDVIPVPEFTPDYTPKGEFLTIADRPVYKVGSPTSDLVLICIYDVFGLHKNTFQGADYLALQSSAAPPLVLMPDFFEGKPLDPARMKEEGYRESWRASNSDTEHLAYLERVLSYVKQTYPGVKAIGLYGFCWGGKLSIMAAKHALVSAVSLIHPSRLSELDADGCESVPVQIIATKDESVESLAGLVGRLEKCEYVRMDDMFHGFAAARGDWGVEEQKERAQEAFRLVAEFFKRVLL